MTDLPFFGEGERNQQLGMYLRQRLPALHFSGECADGYNPVAGPYNWTEIPMTASIRANYGKGWDGFSRYAIQETGIYMIVAHGCWQPNAAGQRGARVAEVASNQGWANSEVNAVNNGGLQTTQSDTGIAPLSKGAILKFEAYNLFSAAIVPHARNAYARGSGMDVYFLGTTALV